MKSKKTKLTVVDQARHILGIGTDDDGGDRLSVVGTVRAQARKRRRGRAQLRTQARHGARSQHGNGSENRRELHGECDG